MRHLKQDSRTVTGILFATAGAPMIEILQDRQRLFDDFVGFLALDIDHESDATGIVLKPRIIKALFGREVGNSYSILRSVRPLCWCYEKRIRESRYCGTRCRQLGNIGKPLASMTICDRNITFSSRWNVLPNFDQDPRFGSPSTWKAQPCDRARYSFHRANFT